MPQGIKDLPVRGTNSGFSEKRDKILLMAVTNCLNQRQCPSSKKWLKCTKFQILWNAKLEQIKLRLCELICFHVLVRQTRTRAGTGHLKLRAFNCTDNCNVIVVVCKYYFFYTELLLFNEITIITCKL